MFVEPDGATPLDPDEIEGLRFAHVTTRAELDELEQANIIDGLQWLRRRRQRDILTDEFLRELHRRLFGRVWAWAGTYRLSEKNIGIDPLQTCCAAPPSAGRCTVLGRERYLPAN